jgi:hypothetical protein
MKSWRVFLRGQNFILKWVNGSTENLGFYTTRFVRANNPEGAELLAVDLIRHDKKLAACIQNQRSDPPMIFADEIEEIEELPESAGAGYAFFPSDSKDEGDA